MALRLGQCLCRGPRRWEAPPLRLQPCQRSPISAKKCSLQGPGCLPHPPPIRSAPQLPNWPSSHFSIGRGLEARAVYAPQGPGCKGTPAQRKLCSPRSTWVMCNPWVPILPLCPTVTSFVESALPRAGWATHYLGLSQRLPRPPGLRPFSFPSSEQPRGPRLLPSCWAAPSDSWVPTRHLWGQTLVPPASI